MTLSCASQPALDAVAVIDAMEAIGVTGAVFDNFIDAFATASDVSLSDLHTAGLAGIDIVKLRRHLDPEVCVCICVLIALVLVVVMLVAAIID